MHFPGPIFSLVFHKVGATLNGDHLLHEFLKYMKYADDALTVGDFGQIVMSRVFCLRRCLSSLV